ncbi:MAG: DUF1223 domain-containing protein [Pyrinomonadaceae bacterium]
MKIVLLIASIFSFLGLITYSVQRTPDSKEQAQVEMKAENSVISEKVSKSPVLVELFTSEGCSSCPPADRNLAELSKQQDVIALGFHVDYWNNLGWTDQFSKAAYSQRQGFYSNTFKLGEVYTPQMIVDGTDQFVGGNSSAANQAISAAAKNEKGNVALTVSGDKLKVDISNLPAHSFANVFLAIAENNLSTSVKRGENGGKTLNHAAVVRDLKNIGSVAGNAKSFQTETTVQIPSDWKKQNLKFVVFAQVEDGSKIIAVNQTQP